MQTRQAKDSSSNPIRSVAEIEREGDDLSPMMNTGTRSSGVGKMSSGPIINRMSESKASTKTMSDAAEKETGSFSGRPGYYAPMTTYKAMDEDKEGSTTTAGIQETVNSGAQGKSELSGDGGNPVIEPTGTLHISSAYPNATIPTGDSPKVEYDYIQTDPENNIWNIKVTKMEIEGLMTIYSWPSFPHCMNVDESESHGMNTPNATVEPYNIIEPEDAEGHPGYGINVWDYVVGQLEDYGTLSAAGPQWHATEASEAHEMYHWNNDIMTEPVNAGNWPAIQQEMEEVSVTATSRREAVGKLTPIVEMIFDDFRTRFADYYMNVCVKRDKVGIPMDGGYAAGKNVLNVYIQEIKDLAARKKWKKKGE